MKPFIALSLGLLSIFARRLFTALMESARIAGPAFPVVPPRLAPAW
jgi:hypothetical protein